MTSQPTGRLHDIHYKDIQHNYTQRYKTQHNNTWQNGVQHNNKSNATLSITLLSIVALDKSAECHLCWMSFMLSVIYAECYLCWVSFMLSVIYAACHLCYCWASFILSFQNKPFMLSAIMLNAVKSYVAAPIGMCAEVCFKGVKNIVNYHIGNTQPIPAITISILFQC
jgi:hypothetical protein